MCEKFKQSKLTCDRLLFGQANKEYNKAMVEAQIKHEKTLAESLKENPKRFYNHIRNFVKTDASVDYLITADGEQITDHSDVAEEFNHFFSSVMTHCSPLTSDLNIECPRQESYIRDIEITKEKIREYYICSKLIKAQDQITFM